MTGDGTCSSVLLGVATACVVAREAPPRAEAYEAVDVVGFWWRCWLLEEGEAVEAVGLGAGPERDVEAAAGCNLLYCLRASSKLIFSKKLIDLMPCSRCHVGHAGDVTE